MKIPLMCLVSSLFLTSAFADCRTDQVSIVQESGFGISLGGGKSSTKAGVSTTTNIPLTISGKQACYHQSNKLEIKTERIKDHEFVEYEISPIEADFENVPSPSVVHYINIDSNQEKHATNVHMMSFLCSGETPIGAEGFSDSLFKLSLGSSVSAKTTLIIATGKAAQILKQSETNLANEKVYTRFLELFNERSRETEIDDSSSDIFIPDVLARTSIDSSSSINRSLYSSFMTRTGFAVNGCSKVFRQVMNEFILENVAKEKPYKDIEIKKKSFSSRYRMRWTL